MRTWRIAGGKLRCGNCRRAIDTGETYLEYRIATAQRFRCRLCGESLTGAPAPDVVEDVVAQRPLEVRHQPSLGLEPIGAVAARSAWRSRGRR